MKKLNNLLLLLFLTAASFSVKANGLGQADEESEKVDCTEISSSPRGQESVPEGTAPNDEDERPSGSQEV